MQRPEEFEKPHSWSRRGELQQGVLKIWWDFDTFLCRLSRLAIVVRAAATMAYIGLVLCLCAALLTPVTPQRFQLNGGPMRGQQRGPQQQQQQQQQRFPPQHFQQRGPGSHAQKLNQQGQRPQNQGSEQKTDAITEERNLFYKFLSTVPDEFNSSYKNPCWFEDPSKSDDPNSTFYCIPLAYILGQPKCGTTDLYDRIIAHPAVAPAERKEVRFFTQTQMSRKRLWMGTVTGRQTLTKYSKQFKGAAKVIRHFPNNITIDGGPHTLWWPHNGESGLVSVGGIPVNRLLKRIVPQARLIVIVRDPVQRALSDFRFKNNFTATSAVMFREKIQSSIFSYRRCLATGRASIQTDLTTPVDYKTVRQCIHSLTGCCLPQDRSTGRIGLGLYEPLLEPWRKLFGDQLLVVKMEDLVEDHSRKATLTQVFQFLGLDTELSEDAWENILDLGVANHNNKSSFEIDDSTLKALKQFYAPYDKIYGYGTEVSGPQVLVDAA